MYRNLSEHLLAATPEQTDRLLLQLDTVPLDARTEQRIAARIHQKRAVGGTAIRKQGPAADTRSAKTRKRTAGHSTSMRRSAVAGFSIAACLLLVLGVLSIPSVSRALYSLLHPDYETDSYMMEQPDNRTPIPEVEEAIAAAAPNGDSYYVELLGEYAGALTKYDEDYNRDINQLRIDSGFPAFDKEEFAFLREIRPEVREVLYDGHSLTINTFLHTDRAADFLSGWAGVDADSEYNLDITCFDYFIKINGQDATQAYASGYSSGTAMSLGGVSNEQIEQLNGVWHTLDISPLPQKLPDGEIEMTILYYIYDGAIDDMGAIGNIGRIVHTFTFDATAGNQGAATSVTTKFTGEAVMTFWDWEKDLMYNRTMPLDELALKAEAHYGSTGIRINMKTDPLPEEWHYCHLFAPENDGRSMGIGFDLYVNGEFVKSLSMLDSTQNEANYELPIFPTEYDEIDSILLRPSVNRVTGLSLLTGNGNAGSDIVIPLITDGDPVDARGSTSFETFEKTPLAGCDIVIPPPKN